MKAFKCLGTVLINESNKSIYEKSGMATCANGVKCEVMVEKGTPQDGLVTLRR